MIYLSRLTLNGRESRVRRDVFNPYEMHRTLSHAFPEGDAYNAARCLFRIEDSDANATVTVLVQSAIAPDWTKLKDAARYLAAEPCMKKVEPHFEPGQILRFRLRANATVCRNGKRVALWVPAPPDATPEQRAQHAQEMRRVHIEWLSKRAEAAGFEVREPEYIIRDRVIGKTASDQKTVHYSVQYDGHLRVTDPKALISALEQGIGPAKGFGFGLLSLAR